MYINEGKTQDEIADELGVTQSTICKDIRDVSNQWKEQAIDDVGQHVAIELRKLSDLEQKAIEQFNATHSAKFLDVRLKILEQRSKYLGLYHSDQTADDGLDKLTALAESFLK